jgi:hypothetical protein
VEVGLDTGPAQLAVHQHRVTEQQVARARNKVTGWEAPDIRSLCVSVNSLRPIHTAIREWIIHPRRASEGPEIWRSLDQE